MVVFDREATLDRVNVLTREAAAGGAELVVFPEAFICGYPQGMTFGATFGSRTPEGREQYRRYWSSAVDIPGPAIDRLGEIATEHAVHLVIGVIERNAGTLYCTALILAPDGRLLGRHRKLIPTALERLVWGQGDGSTLPVVQTSVGRLGAIICWENYMPLLRAAMYAKGVEVYCAPIADDLIRGSRPCATSPRRAASSSCPHASSSGAATVHPTTRPAAMMATPSCIAAPSGELLVEPVYDRPAVLYAVLDLDDIPRGKFDLDVCGSYARPDVFQLNVDERPKPGVSFAEG